jgi:AraC-like DNA-binding protein
MTSFTPTAGQVLATGRELPGRAELSIPEPPYFTRLRGIAPNIRFNRPANRLVFDAAFLECRLATADPAALQLARDQCERALQALGFDRGIAQRVLATINAKEEFCSLDEAAASLGLSPRTLKRKLGVGGTSFTALLDQARLERARELLRSERSLEEIAESLGYSDVANFTRAFRRWTGTTPAAHRKASRSPPTG